MDEPVDPVLEESVVDDAERVGVPASRVIRTRPLTGGRGGRTWRIDTSDDRYVLHRRRTGSVDREAAATSRAAVVGVGPEVLAVDPGSGLLLTRWIPGRAVTAPGLAGDHLEGAVRALRLLHSVDAGDGATTHGALAVVRPLESRAAYLASADEAGDVPAWARRVLDVRDRLDELADVLARRAGDVDPVLIHGDPVPGNLIASTTGSVDEVRLVDFEYAGSGERWYEVGHLAASVHLEPAAIDRVVGVYLAADVPRPVPGPTSDVAAQVEGWSYLAAQAWIAWVVVGDDEGARSPRWQRWAVRAAARLEQASDGGRMAQVAAQLRA